MTFGEKIQQLRKKGGLSQEGLAERIAVTRQTISKWELDQSTPDLEFISQLSDIFGVSTDYLIKEDMATPDGPPVNKRTFRMLDRFKQISLLTFSATGLIAIVVCVICDYFISDGLSWSLISGLSIVSAWLLLLPFLRAKNHATLKTLIVFSAISIPYLVALRCILDRPVVLSLGICIDVVVLLGLWCVYAIFRRCDDRAWKAFGFSFLVMIPIPLAITHIVAYFIAEAKSDLSSDILHGTITLVLAAVCFGMDYLTARKRNEERE